MTGCHDDEVFEVKIEALIGVNLTTTQHQQLVQIVFVYLWPKTQITSVILKSELYLVLIINKLK